MKEIKLKDNIYLTSEGIAVFSDLKIAAAADMHIGFEEAFGEAITRVQTKNILNKFYSVFKRFEIREVIINGDLKYTFGKENEQEWKEVKYFIEELLKYVNVKVAKGNHDFYVESMIRNEKVEVKKEFLINSYLFTHGDEEVSRSTETLLVIGNEHPSIELRDEIGAKRKYPCFLYAEKENILVLPAINPWTYGTNILAISSNSFLSPSLKSIELDSARVFPLDGEEIYDFLNVKKIRELIHRIE